MMGCVCVCVCLSKGVCVCVCVCVVSEVWRSPCRTWLTMGAMRRHEGEMREGHRKSVCVCVCVCVCVQREEPCSKHQHRAICYPQRTHLTHTRTHAHTHAYTHKHTHTR